MKCDAIFPTNNEYGIPVLSTDWQAQWIEAPCRAWGSIGRETHHPGSWHFYTEDYRWNAIIQNPWRVSDTQPKVCVEPNFSVSDDMPAALVLERTYRKRWLARFWQSYGIRVFVDLFVPQHHQSRNLIGVPNGWRAFATRGGDRDIAGLESDFKTAVNHAGEGGVLFAVIGGGRKVRDWCKTHRAIHIGYQGKRNVHSAAVQNQTSPCNEGA